MSDRKLAKAVQTLFRQVTRLSRNMSRALIAWLLRAALVVNRRTRPAAAGFVLPTTVLLILVVSLTAGALSYRAFNTSTRTINETQNRVIYNAATPAIDRARAKIEFLFDSSKDTRFPGGVPSSDFLASMLLNDGTTSVNGQKAGQLLLGSPKADPYTLPDEVRVDSNGDTTADNAWSFRADTDGDNTLDATIVYSIALTVPPNSTTTQGWQRLVGMPDAQKANTGTGTGDLKSPVQFARTGPLSNAPSAAGCTSASGGGISVESGWYQDASNTSKLRRNFQVDAFVLPDSATKPGSPSNFATLEFQQDRVLDRGNKWGAWFRNDLEIFPGPPFQWNGAMHTEGNLIIGGSNFSAYLISAPKSCFWNKPASEITVTDIKPTGFQGQIVSGALNTPNSYTGSSLVYIWTGNGQGGYTSQVLNSSSQSVSSSNPYNLSIDPLAIQTDNSYKPRVGTNGNRDAHRSAYDSPTPNSSLFNRIYNKTETAPYVDDTYRADDRYGPKQKYSNQIQIPSGKKIGDLMADGDIVSIDPTLAYTAKDKLKVQDDPNATKPSDTPNLGLDGYWERRARFQGLRVLVGQRLELGNPFGWVTPQDRPTSVTSDAAEQTYLQTPVTGLTPINGILTSGDGDYTQLRNTSYASSTDPNAIDPDKSDNEGDPLYSPHSKTITHEARQRRALRDNPSAVQSTAVYHFAVQKDYPVACMASVVHPGSPLTLQQSLNFVPTVFVDSTATGTNPANSAAPSTVDTALMTDFFNGRGTDGWEFDSPGGNQSDFERDIDEPDSPLRIALQNLAQFAGDHVNDAQTGAFPPTQESGQIHPDPEFSMWGNFSNLRRTLAQLSSTQYTNLSIADKTYLHTAACTIGMLAYNIDRVQRFDPTNYKNDIVRPGQGFPIVQQLALDLYGLMNGSVNDTNDFEVLPKGRLATYGYDPSGSYTPANYNPRDYDRVPAEAYLGKLREYIAASNSAVNPSNDPRYRLAELIFTHFQIRRDRTFGFRPSPAANTWNYNPFVASMPSGLTLWSSACDPNIFALNADTNSRKTGAAGAILENNFASNPALGRYRLTLSRLCGTVIPPGAVRDYPGDTSFPARNGKEANNSPAAVTPNSPGALTNFIPKTSATPPVYSQDTPLSTTFTQSLTSAFATNTVAPQTRLNDNGTLFPYTVTAATAPVPNVTGYPYLAASVAPKWPSLYYLFPEVTHGHKGTVEDTGYVIPGAGPLGGTEVTFDGVGIGNSYDNDGNGGTTPTTKIPNWEDDVDHRQPDGQLTYPLVASTFIGTLPATTTSNTLPAALQPWPEPYITDSYINTTANQTVVYKPVDTVNPALIARRYDRGYLTSALSFNDPKSGSTLTYQYKTFGTPLEDLPVSRLVLNPRKLPSSFTNPFAITNNTTWQLPVSTLPASPPTQNTPPNRITAPNGYNITGTTAVTPFLDRAMFNGREWLPARVTDIDLGMLRRTKVSATVTGNTSSEVWLPISGIVYAFREDAIREDAINRPASGTYTNVTNPASQTDPAVIANTLISVKPVDGVPDPDRRPYGFRLRNGTQLKRHASTGVSDQDNIRGLSFFTDNPLYIMGNYNLHQTGSDDDATGTRLEEFTVLLPDDNYTEQQFYQDRQTTDTRFANSTLDRWRPSEIIADAISIVSDTLCDGSALDTFMTAGTGSGATLDPTTYEGRTTTDSGVAFPAGFYPYRVSSGNTGGASVYTTTASALYGRGCTSGGKTTFLNQNRPSVDLPNNWAWLRENPYDIFSPIKVSRNGEGLALQSQTDIRPPNKIAPPGAATAGSSPLSGKPLMPIPYNAAPVNGAYFNIANSGSGDRSKPGAENTRVNTIVVSGLIPSRSGQSYGGMHNFPRFLETWDRLWFAGSFLQLSFSNYATAPFDAQVWEPGTTPAGGNERITYYGAPKRLWGYDVALQKSSAGPAASRFVTATKDRNEFYKEPPANDPYIRNLCIALPDTLFPDYKCPS